MKLRQFGLVVVIVISTTGLLGCTGGVSAPDESNSNNEDTTMSDDTSSNDSSDNETGADCVLGNVDNIRGCECFWEAQITGDFNDTFSGTFAVFTLIPAQSGTALAFEFQEFIGATGDSASAFPTGENDAVSGSTGIFDIAMFVSDGPNPFSGGGEATEVQIEIISNTGGSIVGTITGSLEGPDPDDPTAGREVQVTLNFRASESTQFSDPCSGSAP